MTDPTQVNGHRGKVNADIGMASAGSVQIGQTRRVKRSQLSVEQREHNRRLKKQNIERRRRACISDKMTDLHRLAMNIIGCENSSNSKIEKADILGTCHNVFQNVANLIRENPEMKAKLLEVTKPLRIKLLTMDNEHRSASKRNSDAKVFVDTENIDPFTLNPWRNVTRSEIASTPYHPMTTSSGYAFTQPDSRYLQSTPLRVMNQSIPDSGAHSENRYFIPVSAQQLSSLHQSPSDVYWKFHPSPLSSTSSQFFDSGMHVSEDSLREPFSLSRVRLLTPHSSLERTDKLWRPYLD